MDSWSQQMDTLAHRVGQALEASGAILATAESCTGGGVATAITEVAGSSNWFDAGFVTYSNAAKQRMLGVSEQTLAHAGAVSEAVVMEMTAGALERSGATVAVAVSGVAGPGGGSAEKPVGTVWVAWQQRGHPALARRFQFSGGRRSVREQTVVAALEGILALICR
ncbi:CinA family protein [Aestuariirhabdus litorea]|uniref:Nicotinamide-nucleotide amidohydrolase family protein n=1 Tax=Aestuariirhabdus litorea TaxID=2528527 RepID=A0A3P3VRK1_9GAMM|nr:nicotinamide-nucleotide amidohydrolase family protein [Aestuariirhabdus litorea]RRJ85084.1 nicotinamide-nucleotide amidohydrolase family protein [Aestuariirhabdus litorea]RWW98309.1 nicotinamide-nucleotide amidohydrolase family protein [Endozoicomonadaceae bacterium GTF-13]